MSAKWFRWEAAKTSTPQETITKVATNGGVSQAVEGHGGGAGGDHRDDDPEQLLSGWQAVRRQHSSAHGKGECKDGMLPLDHLQGDAQVAEKGHRRMVKQTDHEMPG